jgi:hypothetical protein
MRRLAKAARESLAALLSAMLTESLQDKLTRRRALDA